MARLVARARRQRRLGQTQLDVYGELLDALHLYHEQLGRASSGDPAFIASTRRRRIAFEDPDQGMWEMRGEARHHLSSKVLCWTALDRASSLRRTSATRQGGRSGGRARPDPRGDSRARVERGEQAYAQSFDSDDLDAAQTPDAPRRLPTRADTRMRSTIDAIADELAQDGLVLRYLNDEGLNADGLTGEEGTFVICSFWLVVPREGRTSSTRGALFDKLAATPTTSAPGGGDRRRERELLGNFPRRSATSA